MDHHVFDKVSKAWLRRSSRSQPYIRLQINIQQEYYVHFGYSLRAPQAQSFVSTIADTGCQSCSAGLKKVGVSAPHPSQPQPQPEDACSKQRKHPYLGCNHYEFIWKGRQRGEMLYKTNGLCNTDKLFLSREACVDHSPPWVRPIIQSLPTPSVPLMHSCRSRNATAPIGTSYPHNSTVPSHRSQ